MNIRRITILVFVLAIAALIVGLSACENTLDQVVTILSSDDTPQMEGEEISIGVVLPLTGRLAVAFGEPMGQGFELALKEINDAQLGDARIKFILEDDRSTVEGAIEAFAKLIDQGVPAILGPATSSATEKTFPIAQENHVVAFSPTSAARGLSAIGDFVFRAALTTDVLIPSGIKATHAKLGYKKVATMYDENDLFSTDGDEALREVLTENGVEVLTIETFRSGETDFSAQLTRIKALNPDAIFVSALSPEKPGIMIQARELGIPSTVPFIVRTLTTANVQAAGPAAEGAITFVGWSSTADTPGNRAFVQNYSARYGMEPNNYAARSYAAVYILAEAIGNAQLTGSMTTDATAIRDAMANIMDFPTIFGNFSFDANGDAVYDPKVLIVKNGQLENFE